MGTRDSTKQNASGTECNKVSCVIILPLVKRTGSCVFRDPLKKMWNGRKCGIQKLSYHKCRPRKCVPFRKYLNCKLVKWFHGIILIS